MSGKVYIGQTTQTISDRWSNHKVDVRHYNTVFANALKSYGFDAFTVVELGRSFSAEELNEMEIRAIWSHSSDDREFGYNMEKGGNCAPMSAEARLKIGAAHRGKIVSAETRAKQSAARKGRKMSEEQRLQMIARNTGSKLSAEACEKISAGNKGKVRTDEHRANMRAGWARRAERLAADRIEGPIVIDTRPYDTLTRAEKISRTMRGVKKSEQTRARMRAASKNTSEEHRAKLKAAWVLRKARQTEATSN